MVDKTQNWSRSWNSSTDPSKQRKYRQNAPLHVKDDLVSANLAPELREELGTRSLSLRTGDRVKVVRGDDSGNEGIVSRIDRGKEKVYVNGVEVERTDGTVREKALRPSNLQILALNVEDERRLEKFEIGDLQEVKVEEEEKEEALEEDEESEMMQQMQTGESSLESGDEEETDEETEAAEDETEETGEAGAAADYEEIVSGTISEAKDQLDEIEEPDYEAALEAEEQNKDRKTFKEWLENRTE